MEDKAKVLRLYEKMNSIKINLSNLQSRIEYLQSELENIFVIDEQTTEEVRINNNRNQTNYLKNSIQASILNDLAQYL